MKVGSEYYFYHNDHLGTPQKLTTVSGAVVWSAKYSSFGKAEVDPASTVVNNLRFAGQYYDIECGLHYNWWRYYDFKIGRYIKIDPLGVEAESNYFIYAANNPLFFIDSQGLISENAAKYVPTYGNFCGPGWSGGKRVAQGDMPDMSVDATDDLDQCCKEHDFCYWKNNVTSNDESSCEKIKCDEAMVNCFNNLNQYPWLWKNPPKKWKYGTAINYRDSATVLFQHLIKKGKKIRTEKKLPSCS